MKIRTPKRSEASRIVELDKEIFGELALNLESINALLQMFPEGFFVAEEKRSGDPGETDQLFVGLISTVLWDKDFQPDYSNILGIFPHTHSYNGKVMMIHTIGVLPEFSGKGIGKALIGSVINLAAQLELEKISVISSITVSKMFERLGFSIVRPLPEFIPYHQDRYPQPLLMELNLK